MEYQILKLLMMMAPAALAANGATAVSVSYDFNDGLQGWTPQTGTYLEWTTREIKPAGEAGSFSNIDPGDTASLYTISPQQEIYRTKSQIVSPEVYIGENATLTFYTGFNSYWDSECRLLLEIADADSDSWETLWNSKNTKTDQWSWNRIEIPLNDYTDRDVKFRFYYTTGSNDRTRDKGGWFGDFAIDNFTVTTEKSEPAQPETPAEPLSARIDLPATYRSTKGYPVTPPNTPVTFRNASVGNPTLLTWTFTGLKENPEETTVIREQNPTVTFPNEGIFKVSLVAQDEQGNTSLAEEKIIAAYEADITNTTPKQRPLRYDLGENGLFPGSNTMGITGYAERFSAPPAVITVSGVTIDFTRFELADKMSGLGSIGVHLYTERNDEPNILTASAYMTAAEIMERGIDASIMSPEGVYFSFEEPIEIERDFFVVADGLPAFRSGTCVAIGAMIQDKGNTALAKQNGEWGTPNVILGSEDGCSYLLSPKISYLPKENNNTEDDSVEAVTAAEAIPEYYTPDGRRIMNPGKGLYIVRRGSHAEKIIRR